MTGIVAVLAAVGSSFTIGVNDFLAGVIGRRDSARTGALVVFLATWLVALPVALVTVGPPDPSGLAWGALQGVMLPFGFLALMRGIAEGRIVVVVPVTGLLTILFPVVIDLIGGARPGALLWTGVAVGALALVLIGAGGTAGSAERSTAWSGAMGGLAGVLTGASFVVVDHAGVNGHWLLVASSFTAAVITAVVLVVAGRLRRPGVGVVALAGLMGVLWVFGFSLLLLAFDRGSLTLVTVLTSQYPAVTLVIAAIVWRQRPHGVQYLGVAASLAAISLIAVGA